MIMEEFDHRKFKIVHLLFIQFSEKLKIPVTPIRKTSLIG